MGMCGNWGFLSTCWRELKESKIDYFFSPGDAPPSSPVYLSSFVASFDYDRIPEEDKHRFVFTLCAATGVPYKVLKANKSTWNFRRLLNFYLKIGMIPPLERVAPLLIDQYNNKKADILFRFPSPHDPEERWMPIIFIIVEKGWKECARECLSKTDKQLLKNLRGPNGQTLLHALCRIPDWRDAHDMLAVLLSAGVIWDEDWTAQDDDGYDFADSMGYYKLLSVLWPTICASNVIPSSVLLKIKEKKYFKRVVWRCDYDKLKCEEKNKICEPHTVMEEDESTARLWRAWTLEGEKIEPMKVLRDVVDCKADIFFKGPDMVRPFFHDLVFHGMSDIIGLLADHFIHKKLNMDFCRLTQPDAETGYTLFHLASLQCPGFYSLTQKSPKTSLRRVQRTRKVIFWLLCLVKEYAPKDTSMHYFSAIHKVIDTSDDGKPARSIHDIIQQFFTPHFIHDVIGDQNQCN